ncbi:MAG: molybdopterin oxidoreductase family protein [Acidimicrobiales bacterium]
MADSIHLRTCPLCEAMCGLELQVTDGRVGTIRADRDDVWSKGHLCPKGTTIGHLHHDPDRLRVPMVREGDEWHEVTWDEAFRRCEELIAQVREQHGPAAMTTYIGNPVAHNFALGRGVGPFIGMAGFPTIYSAGTVDQWPKNVAAALMYGNMWSIPTIDLKRAHHVVIMGGNPQASQGSLMACADVIGHLDRIRGEGGRVTVIDPRRTGTADHADEWIPIVPGTDALLLFAMVQVLFAEGLVDLGAVDGKVAGVDEVRRLAEPFTPEAVAATCQVPADTIRRLARDLAAAAPGALYGRIGLCNQEFGTLASWLVDVVNILTGDFDSPGGMMWATPVVWTTASLPDPSFPDGYEFGRWRSRVRGIPEVLGQVPVSCLAEEIDTPGEGQIKLLITVAGNPVLSTPNAGRLDAALPQLDALICVDNWRNETTRHAHVILPGLSSLEQPHFDDLLWAFATGSAGRWSEPLFAPTDGRPDEYEILLRLGALCMGLPHEGLDVDGLDDAFITALCDMKGVDAATVLAASTGRGAERLLDLTIRTGPFGDRYGEVPEGLALADFRAAPHGIDLGPMVPRADEVVCTPSGMIELAPPYITADVGRLRARLDRPAEGLVLVSRRHLRSNNSWMHNVKVLVKGKDRCTLLIHPDDAARCGVADGAVATVRSEAGAVDVPVEVSDEMMPGVVSLPHGWGHGLPGTQLSVANEHAGVNSNLLAPADLYDPISNNAAVNGIPVEVAPA